ncbi:hypothetical protein ACHQM5_026240 [Ranunculus cassubicifolius]
MKFYSLSSGVVSHLLSSTDGKELDLPFEVTEHETEIIHFPRSTFVLGRSGTGKSRKTTVLTMKLIQKEQQYHFSSEGLHVIKNMPGCSKETGLRQLFVTVSPKLCAAIKNHISNLMRFTCGGSFQGDCSAVDMHEIDDTTQFSNVPDSFIDVTSSSFPLVLTFQKFLMMLDRSMENSYFDRFQDVREFSLGRGGTSSSISLLVFIRTKEVNFERFNSLYWPHFNCNLTKRLDPSTVFTEIISYIKGGLKDGKVCDGKLHREDYVSLCEGRASCLSRDRREDIYDIYVDYEKKKIENGHFDLADFVNDLHVRLRQGLYEGDFIDFVYIDEVQDLTMRQIALFKYMNIKALFYNEFLSESDSDKNDKTKEKGQPCVSEIFHLNQNFRTHAGVLNLSQSVVDLLYHYFPFSVDVLSPETSLIYGESPVLLESGNDENAIVTIFGNSGSIVCDDCARKEISNYVGKQALVLTILECKGLEFQVGIYVCRIF